MPDCKHIDEQTIDTRGLICPIPVLKARKKMQQMKQGEVLVVLCDDQGSMQDFQHFCQTQGHRLIAQTLDKNTSPHTITHKIRKNS